MQLRPWDPVLALGSRGQPHPEEVGGVTWGYTQTPPHHGLRLCHMEVYSDPLRIRAQCHLGTHSGPRGLGQGRAPLTPLIPPLPPVAATHDVLEEVHYGVFVLGPAVLRLRGQGAVVGGSGRVVSVLKDRARGLRAGRTLCRLGGCLPPLVCGSGRFWRPHARKRPTSQEAARRVGSGRCCPHRSHLG